MEVKVLGPGCAKCKKLYEEADNVIKQLGVPATLTKVDKLSEIAAYSVLMTPALVIVHPKYWTEYGSLLELTDPFLDTPFLITISVGAQADAALAADYPERRIYHYYPDKPWVFFKRPASEP